MPGTSKLKVADDLACVSECRRFEKAHRLRQHNVCAATESGWANSVTVQLRQIRMTRTGQVPFPEENRENGLGSTRHDHNLVGFFNHRRR